MGKRIPNSENREGADHSEESLGSPPPVGYWRRVRLTILALLAVGGTVMLSMAFVTTGAAVYTSRSEFCVSCHIMEPYYTSWQESTHSDVACIKCHFPPGAAEKVRGKMLGLVQLIKYVTATAGPRLSAEISDASCLRCHDTRLLAGRVDFHGVPFDHQPHLTDLRRGKQLRCTSCHSQIVQGSHMTVTKSTCFLCHFKDGVFNEGLGTCTRCHQIPEGEFELGGGVKFSHDLAYDRGIDCASCHRDLIRGNGEVPRERCTVCHNREDDLQRIDEHEFIHQMHVSEHKVDCLDCHLEIHHSRDPLQIERAAADCKSCHPDQHRAQIDMLLGEGGKSIGPRHGGMATVGMSCMSCHTAKETSSTGAVLWKASTSTCNQCHDAAATERLATQFESLQAVLADIESDMDRARTALADAELDEPKKAEMTQRLQDMEADLRFLRVGNSIHNMHYAGSLIQALIDKLGPLCRDLSIDEPKAQLPEEPGLVQ